MIRFARNLLYLLTLALVLALCSCETTHVYVETEDLLYEDDILIQQESSLTQDKKLKTRTTTTYHDLSGAGYLVTDTSRTATKAHSVTASATEKNGSSVIEVEYTLIETTVNTRTARYSTEVLGTKTARLNKDGSFVPYSSDGSNQLFKGDTFSDDDELFFAQVASLTAPSLVTTTDRINESTGKSYRTEENIDEITVVSVPNTEYIIYSFLGKPFVIAGTTVWNLLKCLGYSFYNFVGGYNLTLGDERQDIPIWMMPSMATAKEKFATAKEANAIEYYPEYHIPFTNNSITVMTTEQTSNEAFISDDNIVDLQRHAFDYTNTMSVSRSVQADAAYTAGIVGLIGTGVTIPVAGLSWVAGFAGGIAMKVAEAYNGN